MEMGFEMKIIIKIKPKPIVHSIEDEITTDTGGE